MKKLGLLVMPLMAISFLSSCGGKEPTKDSYTLTYTYDNGTDEIYVETYAQDESTVKPTWKPEYEGYTFDGWFTKSGKEGNLFTFGNTLSADTVIFAHWSERSTPETTYTITFKNEGEEDKKIENIVEGSIVTENIPTPSSREGHIFIGWCTDTESKNVFDFNNIKIYQDYILYSGWQRTSDKVIIFKKTGEKDAFRYVSLNNLIFTTPEFTSTPHYDGKWYCEEWGYSGKSLGSGETCYDLAPDILTDYIFVYQEDPHEYTLTFNYTDGRSTKRNISIDNLTITAPETQETPQPGCHYVWKSDNLIIESKEKRTFDKSELKDYVFNETEKDDYSITYILGDEKAVNPNNPTSYKVSENITLSTPTLEGFTFSGWYLSDNEHNKFEYQTGWEAGQMTGNITLYADWHDANKTLNNYSWSEISSISSIGEASKHFDIGDTKNVFSSSINQQVRIIDYNFDKVSTSANDAPQYAGITFEFISVISDFSTYWNNKDEDNSNNLDFIHYSDLNDCLQSSGNVYGKLDTVEGLMNAIKEVVKSVEIGTPFTLTDYKTKLFPLSYDEVDSLDIKNNYEYYKTDSQNRRKKNMNYWLRSPRTVSANNDQAWTVNRDNGTIYSDFIYVAKKGVAPAFCI